MSAEPEYWLELARYDIDTAAAMLKTKRFVYVLVMCQQAVEKNLKALYARRYGEIPPRIHNLVELAKRCELEITPEQDGYLQELNYYYTGARYPSDISELSLIDYQVASSYYDFTLKFKKWIEKELIGKH